jgi:hypothetical protein
MFALPPNVAPMKGVNSQSADAGAGAAADVRAMNDAAIKTLRSDMFLLI